MNSFPFSPCYLCILVNGVVMEDNNYFKDILSRIESANSTFDASYVRNLPEFKEGDDGQGGKASSANLDNFCEENQAKEEENKKLQGEIILQDRLQRGAKAEAKVFELQQLLHEQAILIDVLKKEQKEKLGNVSSKEHFHGRLVEQRHAVSDLAEFLRSDDDEREDLGNNNAVKDRARLVQELATSNARVAALEAHVKDVTTKLRGLELEQDAYRTAAEALERERETSEYWRLRCDELEDKSIKRYRDENGLGSLVGIEMPKSVTSVVRKPRVWRYPKPK